MKRYNLILLFIATLAMSTIAHAQNINSTYTPSRNQQQVAGKAGGANSHHNSTNRVYHGNGYNTYQNSNSDNRRQTNTLPPSGFSSSRTSTMTSSGSGYTPSISAVGATSAPQLSEYGRTQGPRKVGIGGEDDDENEAGNEDDPFATPIGSLPIALMLLLSAAYATRKRRKTVEN